MRDQNRVNPAADVRATVNEELHVIIPGLNDWPESNHARATGATVQTEERLSHQFPGRIVLVHQP